MACPALFRLGTLLLIVSLLLAASAQCPSERGALSDPYCLCRSGYYNIGPSDCNGEHNGSCPFIQPQMLATSNPVQLDRTRSRMASNAFEFYILSDFTQGRLMKKITLNSNVEGCVYPGSFTKGLHECQDEFSGLVPFSSLLNNCSFIKTDQNTYVGNIFVEVEDFLGDMRGHPLYRTTKSFIKIAIHLPTFVTFRLSPNTTVYSAPGLMATVTRQKLNLQDKQNVGIEVVASLQYPYIVVSATLRGPSGIVGSAPNINNEKCGDPAPRTPCFQRLPFDFIIPANRQSLYCNLTGDYTVDFTVGCRVPQAECPLSSFVLRSYTFHLISPTICNPVDIVLTIRPTLESYADLSRKSPKYQFMPNQTVFFFIDLESSITLSSAQIISLNFTNALQQTDQVKVLCSNAACDTPLANSTRFGLIPFSHNSTGFFLNLVVNQRTDPFDKNVHLFDSRIADYVNMTLSIWLSVTFPPKFQSKKRGLLAEEKVLLKTRLILDLTGLGLIQPEERPATPDGGDPGGDQKSEARGLRAGLGGLGLVVLLPLLLAAMLAPPQFLCSS